MSEEVTVEPAGETISPSLKVSPVWLCVIALSMFGAAVWAGGEIAKGEIAQQQLDSITAAGKVLRAKENLKAGLPVTITSIEVVDTFANRVEPYCLTGTGSALGKTTKFGLERGQLLTVKDLN